MTNSVNVDIFWFRDIYFEFEKNILTRQLARMLWVFLARVGQNFTNVQRDGPTKDNISIFLRCVIQ